MRRALFFLALAGCAAGAAAAKIERNSPSLEFSVQWPDEAAAIPALDGRFRAEAAKSLRQAQGHAAEDRALARSQDRDFNGHHYSEIWETAGSTGRLLSLTGSVETFTGGAHPNRRISALLWDRRLGRSIPLTALFTRPQSLSAVTRTTYCRLLDAERLRRREGEKLGGQFDVCPKLAELAASLVDRNNNGRFDAVDFIASPYVAGPYVEGEYEVRVPVTKALVAALKPEYRALFEAQPQ